jgi:hypothetical protein
LNVVVTLVVGLAPVLAVIVTGLFARRKLEEIHVIVNAQRTALEARIAQLEETIKGSNKEIPASTRETGKL